ncbi:TetR/AcrR family transcriptional regulator [Glaciecola punicea ACAM 611]|uniref:TetR/AcrR family transcriptional regulator n=2 Tax=Glaciecola TaxID=89404 RepID=H5TC71_9ALTE|nr:transcriptional regulator [Glaciecola punicea]GAB55898.1 TetR/AcrR family transcriptional regulator [Glaciecola punicea ACAM 611]
MFPITTKKKSNPTTSIGLKRRTLIISAALKAFAEHGYSGASIQKIADSANLSKTNVLYYFRSKKLLYSEVMSSILSIWDSSFDRVTVNDCPAQALANYIAEKMENSRTMPLSSKVFAIEIINGGPNLDTSFKHTHKLWVQDRITLIEDWMTAGKMDNINPEYLLHHIWASTQYYADFSYQIENVHGAHMSQQEFTHATNTVIKLILKGCGLIVPEHYLS